MEIKLNNLSKVFTNRKTGKEVRAVDNIDLTIPSGKLIGLLGPSGCGKTTSLFMIAGLHDVTEGKIFFGNRDVTRLMPDKRGIGLVFQNYALYPHMTVQQNVMFPLENMKVSRVEAVKRAQEMADLVGIGDLIDRKPSELSGGQQQRVAIARALVKKPEVLLLDEPLSNLDARLRLQMREEIKRIQRETGITTVFVTHDQEEAMSISDEIVVMKAGKIQQIGAPQDVYLNPKNKFVAEFLGAPPINMIKGFVKSGKLYVGEQLICDKKGVNDGEYHVGLRPEDFRVTETGIKIESDNVEVIGRDTMIRFELGEYPIRSIVDSESVRESKGLYLSIKAERVHLFDLETQEVI